jgi:phage terminase large subunit-like protein
MDHALLAKAIKSNDPQARQLAARLLKNPLYTFTPRPDRPELYDEQTSFYLDKFPGTACVLAGNGSGKSFVAGAKVAKFLAETPPPEPNTPFWILSQTMEMVTACCWGQNLKHFIPPEFIDSIQWYREARGLPKAIVLKKHSNGNNYVIELRSYDQSREALQAANIIGFLLDEQCPMPIYREVLARTRKWNYPGSKLMVLTPLAPDPDPENLQYIFEHQEDYPSWRFYRFNTRLNQTLDPNFVRNIEENEIAALAETRLIGSFARFEGAIYPQFDPAIHVIDPIPLERPWLHVRGLDLGWSHGTACVWAARDLEGHYYIYREYLETQTSVEDHVSMINAGWPEVVCKGHTYADPAAAQTLYEFSLRGLSTVPANKDVMAGIATVQSLLRPGPDGKPKLLIFSTCPLLISQMRSYVWDAKRPDKPLKVNDDLVDALRYLCHSHRMDSAVETKPLRLPDKKKMVMV